jgi:hypothetical protein
VQIPVAAAAVLTLLTGPVPPTEHYRLQRPGPDCDRTITVADGTVVTIADGTVVTK